MDKRTKNKFTSSVSFNRVSFKLDDNLIWDILMYK